MYVAAWPHLAASGSSLNSWVAYLETMDSAPTCPAPSPIHPTRKGRVGLRRILVYLWCWGLERQGEKT